MPDQNGRDDVLAAPLILDRSHHPISRRNIDPDALKVLNRLHRHGFISYLVGGAVRDLMLGRIPQDFDVGTNARPRQVKKLFRNAYLIGRRFRLAQVRFHGGKVIEVATFRRDPQPGEPEPHPDHEDFLLPEEEERPRAAARPVMDIEPEEAEAAEGIDGEDPEAEEETDRPRGRRPLPPIAFGTPREDAFRRDITINALFYDIATFSVIDYVGGLEDLERKRIRIIGSPERRYTEDPVRIWRVLRHAGRLGFAIEDDTARAIEGHRPLLAGCSGARLYEELNKDLKSGASRPFFQGLRRHGLLAVLLGRAGKFYQESEEAFLRLDALLGILDASLMSGAPNSLTETYGLMFYPWAESLLAGFSGDRYKRLHDEFGAAGMAVTLPRALTADFIQALVITDRMMSALRTGRMRWALRRRARYTEASRLCALLSEGRPGQSQDPFAELFRGRYGEAQEISEKRQRRRRRKPRKSRPRATGP